MVRIDHLTVQYGSIVALHDVSAVAAPGRITAVLGPNAAGKSTLLRACLGSIKPASGRVIIGGKPAHAQSARRLARTAAYVPQRPIVSAGFTVREVVALGRFALPANAARVERAIEEMDLASIAERPVPHLSVGQQQRVAVARALAQVEPGASLLLDEPTSAMDVRHRLMVRRLLRGIASSGSAVLIALHDLREAALLADAAWLLRDARLVATGPVAETLQPETLRAVFDVDFTWTTLTDGRSIPIERE
jgi:iron complex transport system ATP-binding protein